MAVVILMLVLVPTASFVMTGTRVISNTSLRAVAESVATSQLDNLRSLSFPSPETPTSASTAASWSGPNAVTVNQRTFQVYLAGGWCLPTTSGGSSALGNAPSIGTTLPVYLVRAKVAWGPTAIQPAANAGTIAPGAEVMMSGLLPASTDVPASGAVNSCPGSLS